MLGSSPPPTANFLSCDCYASLYFNTLRGFFLQYAFNSQVNYLRHFLTLLIFRFSSYLSTVAKMD